MGKVLVNEEPVDEQASDLADRLMAVANFVDDQASDLAERLVAVAHLRKKIRTRRDAAQRKLTEAQIELDLITGELQSVLDSLKRKNMCVGKIVEDYFEV